MLVSRPSSRNRMAGLVAIVLLLLVAAGVAVLNRSPAPASPRVVATGPSQPAMASASLSPTAPTPVPPPVPASRPLVPSFDVVRVSPGGSVVMAGHAEPGAEVMAMLGSQVFDRALANARGAWVMVPAARLPTGAAVLTLTSHLLNGATVAGDTPVVVSVPAAPPAPLAQTAPRPAPATVPAAPAPQIAQASPAPAPARPVDVAAAPALPATAVPMPPLALLLPPVGPSRLLQGPAPAGPGTAKLGLDTVDYDDKGAIRFSGSAPAKAPVRVYVDNAPTGDAVADPAGHWAMTPAGAVPPGLHQLRVDELDTAGHVAHRVELPFQREAPAAITLAAGQVVVQPGQNLWRLARQTYGAGIRYIVIYAANRDQIRDARLIYPGQVFAMPAGALAAAAAQPVSQAGTAIPAQ